MVSCSHSMILVVALSFLVTFGVPHAAASIIESGELHGMSRKLEQAELQPALNVTTVSTPNGLLAAVNAGALDIVITEHLDLTTLDLLDTALCPEGCESPLGGIYATRSIRGNCSTQPDADDFPTMNGVPLVPTITGQCFLLTNDDMLAVVNSKFWADNLYLRAALKDGKSRDSVFPALVAIPLLSTGGVAEVYLTNMIFQGDGEGSVVGIGADDKVFVQDSLFTSLGGSELGFCSECLSGIEARAAITIQRCRFEQPFQAPGSRYISVYKGGSVRLENNTYAPAAKSFALTDSGEDKAIGVYSDVTTLKFDISEERFQTRPPSALSDIPAEDPENPGVPLFLSAEDVWFTSMRQAVTQTKSTQATPESVEEEAEESDPGPAAVTRGDSIDASDMDDRGKDSGSSNNTIIGVAVGLVAGCAILAALTAFLVIRKRRRKASQQAAAHDKMGLQSQTPYNAHPSLRMQYPGTAQWNEAQSMYSYADGQASHRGVMSDSSGSQLQTMSSGLKVASGRTHFPPSGDRISQLQMSSQSNVWSSMHGPQVTLDAMGGRHQQGPSTFDTLSIPTTVAAPEGPPPEGARMELRMEFLHRQLDSLELEQRRLLDRFMLIGQAQRRQGGQGLVAFATGAYDDLDYAIKFFLHRPSFVAECALYKAESLGKLLPQIEGVYDPQEATSAQLLHDKGGNPLPPFIVMEKGESLIDWSKRNRSDVFQAVAVLAHVAMRLKDLHAAGYAHRDIKPGNIMLLHRKNRWTLIDFGCVAPIGTPAGLSFTLHYAAPEAVEAWHREEKKIVADGALDAWALGVVAFELLTRKQAFQMIVQSKDEVVSALRGEKDLPWEGENLAKLERKLGKMRQPVLALLHRDPSQRMTPAEFVRECNSLFAVDTVDHHQENITSTVGFT